LFFSGIPGMRSLNALAVGWDIGVIAGLFYSTNRFWKLIGFSRNDFLKADAVLPFLLNLIYSCVPAVLSEVALVCSNFSMYRLLSDWHVAPEMVAAWTIKLKLEELLALIPIIALGMATSVLVGQSCGAGFIQRIKSVVFRLSVCSSLAMFALACVVVLFSDAVAALFCTDLASKNAVSVLLKFSLVIWPLSAFSTICCAAMEGCGQMFIPMALNIVFQVFCRLCLCHFFHNEKVDALDSLNMAQGFALSLLAFFGVSSWRLHLRVIDAAKSEKNGDGADSFKQGQTHAVIPLTVSA
jgi:Na+-driven multidrug efflux pump